jgi:hypothetical protein
MGSYPQLGLFTDSQEPTGFVNRTATLSWDDDSRTLTITGDHTFYQAGKIYARGTNTKQIGDVTGLHYIYYNTGTLSETAASFPGMYVPLVAFVYWNSSTGKGVMSDERHGITMDGATHEMLHMTVGPQWATGYAGTFGDTTFTIGAGTFYDEDLSHTTSGDETTCNVFYKDGSANWQWSADSSTPYYLSSDVLTWNNGTTLSTTSTGDYVAVWVFATNIDGNPIAVLIGQSKDTTLANAKANNKYENLSLGTLPSKEWKILYRVIYRQTAGGPDYIEAEDMRAVKNLSTGTYLASDHGNLTGLTDDDHTQYALLANTRGDQSFAGDVNVATTFSVGDQNKFTIDYTAYNITDIVHYGASALRFWTISAESDISFLTVSSERLRLSYDGKVNVIYPGGFGFKANSGSNYLRLACGTTLGADRTLTFTPGDSNRTLNFTSGATGKVFSSDASGDGSWSYPSADITSITQNSHGFVAGDVLYHTGTVYEKAKADAESTSEAIGVVSASIDTNTFTLVTGGYISGLSGLTAGSVYYLSGATAGAITATEPTTEGHVSKPILIAVSTTTGFVFNMRGLVVGGEATYHRSFVNADLSTGVLTVTHNLGHTYVQVCVSNNSSKVVIPDDITFSSSNALAIDLKSFGTLTGTWHVSVFDIGGTMTTYDQSLNTTDSPTFSQGNFTTTHTTTALVDHIGQHTASHRVIFDNEALFAPTSCGIDMEPIVVGGSTFDFALVSTIDRTTTTYNNMFIGGHSDTAASAGGTLAFGRRRKSSPYTIQSGDRIGSINFYGYDATDFGLAAQIIAEVDGTPGAGDMPGRILFSTSPDGSEAPTERMRISSTGEIYTVVWQSFSPAMTGIDDYTGGGWSNFAYMKIGRLVWVTWDFYGHYNAGSASLAFALPYTAAAGCWWNPCSIADNAVWLSTPGQSIIHSGISTTTCIFGKTTSAASYNDFTATGGAWKGSRGQMWYYATS